MIPFAETPQGKGLLRQIDAAHSNWRIATLWDVFWTAAEYYEQHNGVPPGQQHDDLQTTEKEISMSLEQALAANTAALEANTAALLGAKTSAAAAAGATDAGKTTSAGKGKAGKAEAKKNEHTREELVAVLGEVKEKFDVKAARACFAPTEKMADIPEADIDKVYAAAKAKLEEEEEEEGM